MSEDFEFDEDVTNNQILHFGVAIGFLIGFAFTIISLGGIGYMASDIDDRYDYDEKYVELDCTGNGESDITEMLNPIDSDWYDDTTNIYDECKDKLDSDNIRLSDVSVIYSEEITHDDSNEGDST